MLQPGRGEDALKEDARRLRGQLRLLGRGESDPDLPRDQASPTVSTTSPSPPHSGQGSPSTRPVPPQRRQTFSAVWGASGEASSPGVLLPGWPPAGPLTRRTSSARRRAARTAGPRSASGAVPPPSAAPLASGSSGS